MPASSHINSTERCFKYLSHDDWVTSGKIGSREAVLVFRTNILNPKTRKSLLETPPEERELKTADSQVTLSTPSELIHKCASSPAIKSGYDSATASQSNTEINTSEEDHGGSSEEDNECGVNMPAHQLKITYKFIQTETKLLRKIFNVHGLTEVQGDSNFNLLWTGVHMKLDTLRNLTLYQRVNHFPRSYELTRKDRLYKNIERMQHLRGMKHFDIVPQSFILPLESRDLLFAHNKHRGPWIVKPAASSRGRGIFIVNSPDQIPQDEQVLVSKYIVDPLCIDGHKCDLRVYVLVTSFDPLIIYLYEEALTSIIPITYDHRMPRTKMWAINGPYQHF
ncbi:hypothetical protein ACLKA7_008336 [Drosophila subpalustris]